MSDNKGGLAQGLTKKQPFRNEMPKGMGRDEKTGKPDAPDKGSAGKGHRFG